MARAFAAPFFHATSPPSFAPATRQSVPLPQPLFMFLRQYKKPIQINVCILCLVIEPVYSSPLPLPLSLLPSAHLARRPFSLSCISAPSVANIGATAPSCLSCCNVWWCSAQGNTTTNTRMAPAPSDHVTGPGRFRSRETTVIFPSFYTLNRPKPTFKATTRATRHGWGPAQATPHPDHGRGRSRVRCHCLFCTCWTALPSASTSRHRAAALHGGGVMSGAALPKPPPLQPPRA